ncbi:hypothetical protein GCWU000342_01076 [Shuttleworthella satelles DSM 14600]|uniref:Uncharacterized protein n=1 Tax=Shuttleworthella satelles DSM 14600 TaxID=626523 RepID=C4GAX6_9FIRM|nr:hypothetical protein GCWU000342_01076 [Shuttleworthia satelles DSM 14600]
MYFLLDMTMLLIWWILDISNVYHMGSISLCRTYSGFSYS